MYTAIGVEGTVTEAIDQKKVVDIPANPVLASSVTNIECSMGAIGIALNGVSIYGGVCSFSFRCGMALQSHIGRLTDENDGMGLQAP